MKNIIPFKKDVIFKTNISEVVSISLENTLDLDNDIVKGMFIISGEYKINDKSNTVDPFNLELPFEIVIDEKYDTKKAIIDIDDFYYEIINDNVLRIAIDVLIDKLEEKVLIDDIELIDETPKRVVMEEDSIEEKNEVIMDKKRGEEIMGINNCSFVEDVDIALTSKPQKEVRTACFDETVEEKEANSLFSNFSNDREVYVSYNVYIVREGDTIESIIDKYNIEIDELKKYNDLNELKLGDKLIIPNSYETD